MTKTELEALQISAQSGQVKSQFHLGILYYTGELPLSQDRVVAAYWLRKAAEQGDADAQELLGTMLSGEGNGIPVNVDEGFDWLYRAALQGRNGSQYLVGTAYHFGCGTQKDEAEAIKWFLKAASQNNPQAQTQMGLVFYEGRGMPKDPAIAIKWFRMAAERGSAESALMLGSMLALGEGTPEDPVEAHAWLIIAGAHGQKNALDIINRLRQYMAVNQCEEAEALAQKIYKRIPKPNA